MSLEIRRKGNKNFTHIDSDFDNQYGANDITIIFEGNTIKIRSFNGRIIFKRDGYDLSEVSIYDDTASGSQENFNDINLFKQRLINLGYPFAGGSVSGGGIPEAPNDGQQYGRQNEGWTVVTGGSGGGIPEAPNDGQQYARQSEAWSVVTGGDATLTKDVNQVGHGFSVGDAIYFDGTDYIKGNADSLDTSGIIGIVKTITDSNNFVYQYGGIMTEGTWVLGKDYFLSNTTDGLVSDEPTYLLGEVRVYVGQGVENGLLINIDIGQEITEQGGSGVQSIVAGTNVTVDNTDPQNPVVSSSGGSSSLIGFVAKNSNTVVNAAVFTRISFSITDYQNSNDWNGTTYTVPEDGIYFVSGHATFQSVTDTKNSIVAIYLNNSLSNGGLLGRSRSGGTGLTGHGGSIRFVCNAGDTIDMYVFCENATSMYQGIYEDGYNTFSIFKM